MLIFSKREHSFLRRNNSLPRKEMFTKYQARFSRPEVKLHNLRDQMRRLGLRSPKRPSQKSVLHYSAAELKFLKANYEMKRADLHALFVERFNRTEVSISNLKSLLCRKGWVLQRTFPVEYSEAERSFLKKHHKLRRRDLLKLFVETFNRPDVTEAKIRWLCWRSGWINGFRNMTRPTGFERVAWDGTIFVRLEETHHRNKRHNNWTTKQRLRWERKHGPVPDGHVLKCMDGNVANTNPSNWVSVPRGMIARLNKRGFTEAPAALKPTILAVARLDHGIQRQRSNKAGSGEPSDLHPGRQASRSPG